VRLLEKVVSGRGVPYMFNELLQQAGLQWLELEAILFQKTKKPYLIPLNGSSVLKFYLHKLVRFAHNWNVGILECWNTGFWENGKVGYWQNFS
jgi:hypothetical protein